MTEETKETRHTRPLIHKPLVLLTWKSWKLAWGEAVCPQVLNGLLHCIFDARTEEREDAFERLRFLLHVADGHNSLQNFPSNRRFHDKHEAEVQKEIAIKAVKVLCDHWFKVCLTEEDRPRFTFWRILKEDLLEDVLWFFDDVERYGDSCRSNLPHPSDTKHHEVILRDFVKMLIGETWTLDRSYGADHDLEGEELEAWQAKFNALRPAYIRLLWRMGDLNFLTEQHRMLDDASMAELRKLALQKRFRGEYSSVDEAVYDGHHPARIYKIAETMRSEGERQRRIAEAERKKREAERELELAQKA